MTQRSMTQGPITQGILLFALPLMLGNLLQQMYNIADTWVVGRFLGPDALAAVGSSYTLMTFLTSILLGLCMGSGAAISMQFGSGEEDRMRQSVFLSFSLIAGISLLLGGEEHLFEGIVEGRIIDHEQGSEGFGYDPLFIPDGYDRTFAQMTTEEKNAVSHRARAVRKLADYLHSIKK